MTPSRASIGSGVLWSLLESGLTQVLGTAAFLLIARYVTPTEFGVIVITLLILDFVRGVFIEAIATTMMAMREPTNALYNACFLLTAAIAVGFTVLLYFGASTISSILGIEGLGSALQPAAFVLLATGVSRTHEAWLSRHLQFRPLAQRSVVSVSTGGVTGVIMAVNGFGIWSLIAQHLVAAFSAALLLWFTTPWRPGWATDRVAVKSLVLSARHLLTMNFTNFAHGQMDTAMTAYYLGPTQTGLYGVAKRIGLILQGVLAAPLARVATPALAGIQDDRARLQRAYLQAISMTAALTAPAFAGLAAIAPILFHTILGERWVAAAPVAAAIAPHFFMVTIGQYNFSVLLVKSKAKWLSNLTMFYAAVGLILLLVAVPYGMLVLAIAASIRTLILSPLSTTLALRVLGLRWGDYVRSVTPPVVCALLMAGTLVVLGEVIDISSAALKLIVLIFAGSGVYGTLLLLVDRKVVVNIRDTIQRSLSRTT